jgi:hypothetical protein
MFEPSESRSSTDDRGLVGGPSAAVASLEIASSPVINATGTPKWPAIAALNAASVTDDPLTRTSASVAEEKVCARTPEGLTVEA